MGKTQLGTKTPSAGWSFEASGKHEFFRHLATGHSSSSCRFLECRQPNPFEFMKKAVWTRMIGPSASVGVTCDPSSSNSRTPQQKTRSRSPGKTMRSTRLSGGTFSCSRIPAGEGGAMSSPATVEESSEVDNGEEGISGLSRNETPASSGAQARTSSYFSYRFLTAPIPPRLPHDELRSQRKGVTSCAPTPGLIFGLMILACLRSHNPTIRSPVLESSVGSHAAARNLDGGEESFEELSSIERKIQFENPVREAVISHKDLQHQKDSRSDVDSKDLSSLEKLYLDSGFLPDSREQSPSSLHYSAVTASHSDAGSSSILGPLAHPLSGRINRKRTMALRRKSKRKWAELKPEERMRRQHQTQLNILMQKLAKHNASRREVILAKQIFRQNANLSPKTIEGKPDHRSPADDVDDRSPHAQIKMNYWDRIPRTRVRLDIGEKEENEDSVSATILRKEKKDESDFGCFHPSIPCGNALLHFLQKKCNFSLKANRSSSSWSSQRLSNATKRHGLGGGDDLDENILYRKPWEEAAQHQREKERLQRLKEVKVETPEGTRVVWIDPEKPNALEEAKENLLRQEAGGGPQSEGGEEESFEPEEVVTLGDDQRLQIQLAQQVARGEKKRGSQEAPWQLDGDSTHSASRSRQLQMQATMHADAEGGLKVLERSKRRERKVEMLKKLVLGHNAKMTERVGNVTAEDLLREYTRKIYGSKSEAAAYNLSRNIQGFSFEDLIDPELGSRLRKLENKAEDFVKRQEEMRHPTSTQKSILPYIKPDVPNLPNRTALRRRERCAFAEGVDAGGGGVSRQINGMNLMKDVVPVGIGNGPAASGLGPGGGGGGGTKIRRIDIGRDGMTGSSFRTVGKNGRVVHMGLGVDPSIYSDEDEELLKGEGLEEYEDKIRRKRVREHLGDSEKLLLDYDERNKLDSEEEIEAMIERENLVKEKTPWYYDMPEKDQTPLDRARRSFASKSVWAYDRNGVRWRKAPGEDAVGGGPTPAPIPLPDGITRRFSERFGSKSRGMGVHTQQGTNGVGRPGYDDDEGRDDIVLEVPHPDDDLSQVILPEFASSSGASMFGQNDNKLAGEDRALDAVSPLQASAPFPASMNRAAAAADGGGGMQVRTSPTDYPTPRPSASFRNSIDNNNNSSSSMVPNSGEACSLSDNARGEGGDGTESQDVGMVQGGGKANYHQNTSDVAKFNLGQHHSRSETSSDCDSGGALKLESDAGRGRRANKYTSPPPGLSGERGALDSSLPKTGKATGEGGGRRMRSASENDARSSDGECECVDDIVRATGNVVAKPFQHILDSISFDFNSSWAPTGGGGQEREGGGGRRNLTENASGDDTTSSAVMGESDEIFDALARRTPNARVVYPPDLQSLEFAPGYTVPKKIKQAS
eukprot:jgi/Bigna1/81509/fgenesh1_pg.81_\